MYMIILATTCFVLAAVGPQLMRSTAFAWPNNAGRLLVRGVGLGLGVVLLSLTSWTVVGEDQVGHLKRVIGGRPMKPGQVVALDGENGPAATVLSPGFYFMPLLNLAYQVELNGVVSIPDNKYGLVIARDGEPLRPDQFLADAWAPESFRSMLDAEYFLAHGGQKGPQLTVLPPGTYRLNQYLFDVKIAEATDIDAGKVGVVKSNVQLAESCGPIASTREGAVSVPLVPRGCRGVWNEPLLPGRYYLNELAYNVTQISTRAQAVEYGGGHKKRSIDLTIDQKGQIVQTERAIDVPVAEGALGKAITTRVEGWEIPLDVRLLVQVAPADAPFVVASIGTLNDVKAKVLTPIVRDVVRNVVGATGRRALELIDRRAELEALVEREIRPEGERAGITIMEFRFGDPILPPELVVPQLREQLARQLEQTYAREKLAQESRIEMEKARATAEQQAQLAAAELEVKVAGQQKEAARLRGEGRRVELEALAAGQREQAAVLGQDRVAQLESLREVLAAAKERPDIVKVPTVLVQGSNGSVEGAAAILGASNLVQTAQGRR